MPNKSERIDVRIDLPLIEALHRVRRAFGLPTTSAAVRHALTEGTATLLEPRSLLKTTEMARIHVDLNRIAGALVQSIGSGTSEVATIEQLNAVLSRLKRSLD